MYKDINPFGLRLPAELKEQVEKFAEENHRSLNAELVAVIHQHYQRETLLKGLSNGDLIDELIRRFGKDGITIQIGKPKEQGEAP